jgi:hypothetical protein
MNRNIRHLYKEINGFLRGYQPRRNFAKDENGDLLAVSHNILKKWQKYYSLLLNAYRVTDIRQKYTLLGH